MLSDIRKKQLPGLLIISNDALITLHGNFIEQPIYINFSCSDVGSVSSFEGRTDRSGGDFNFNFNSNSNSMSEHVNYNGIYNNN